MATTWTPPKSYETRSVAILGAGVLGRRVACVWAAAGYDVALRDPNQQQREDALEYIKENVVAFAEKTGKTPGKASAHEDLAPVVENAWMVVEAVPERLSIKIDTFGELDKVAPSDCLLVSNSSSFKSSEMLEKVRPETRSRILNTHYCMPPTIMVVELMTDGHTHPEIFPWLVARFNEATFEPYVARKESTGFIFNRIWAAIKREILTTIADGVSDAAEIDGLWGAMFGNYNPPCKLMDSVGLDTVAFIEDHYIKERGLPSEKTVDFLKTNYISQGKLGAKSSKGGLYPPTTPDTATDKEAPSRKFVVCEMGMAKPLTGKSMDEMCASGRLLEVSADGKSTRTLVEMAGLPDGVDVCKSNGRLYWTDMAIMPQNNGSIRSCKIDGSDVKYIFRPGTIHTPKQIIVEDKSQKLYFCDREGLRVMRCNLDGSDLETLIQTGDWHNSEEKNDRNNWCVGITVAPSLGKFFWTQKGPSKGNQGRIFSANLKMAAGETATTRTDIECHLKGLSEPVDLEWDDQTSTLYWTDRGEVPYGNTLNRAKFNAAAASEKVKHEIIAQNFHEAIGLKIDQTTRTIFITDVGGTLWRCNLDGTGKSIVLQDETNAFTGLTLL